MQYVATLSNDEKDLSLQRKCGNLYEKNHTTDNSAITRTLTLSIMEDRIDEMHIALPFKNLCDLRKKVKQIVMFEICLG